MRRRVPRPRPAPYVLAAVLLGAGGMGGCGGEATVVVDPAPAVDPRPAAPRPAPVRRTARPERREERPAPAVPLVVRDAPADREPLLPEPDPLEPELEVPPQPPGAPVTAADAGQFITALCEGPGGVIWVGTEDRGVLRHDPRAPAPAPQADGSPSPPRWTQDTELGGSGGGLPDPNCYALCVDKLGRVWAGRQHSGVSVFNGQSWQNYGVLDGPLGERVFDIAADPVTGDIWIASSRGLARYHLDEDRWSYHTRAGVFPPPAEAPGVQADDLSSPPSPLPSDQVEALAFAPDGTLYAGTQCDGLSIARPADDYATWETVTASKADRVETEPVGKGLPSDQFNDVLVHSDGTIYAATVRGLARSTDGGGSWTYTRGRDYADKVKRRFGGPPSHWKAIPNQDMAFLLPEDYVTTLAEAPDGKLWLGFRQHGLITFDPATNETEEVRAQDSDLPEDFVTALIPTTAGAWAGTYGGGVARLEPADVLTAGADAVPPLLTADQPAGVPSHPAPAAPPTADDLRALAAELEAAPRPGEGDDVEPAGAYLGQDWQTKGDWYGRYGRSRAMLCAMGAPLNFELVRDYRVDIRGHVGPNHKPGELLRHWVHKLWWDDRRVMYNPILGYRRQASWDDHAEAYPMSHEGPDVWVEFEVPAGEWGVSLYFFNKDGHRGRNRYRDYLLDLRTARGSDPGLNRPMHDSIERLGDTVARARVREFWGGAWHRFAVVGPAKYRVKIACNDSFNTIVSGFCVDQFHGEPDPKGLKRLPYTGGNDPAPPPGPQLGEAVPADARAAQNLFAAAGDVAVIPAADFRGPALRLALRVGRDLDPALFRRWRWDAHVWADPDRAAHDDVMERAWAANILVNKRRAELREADRRKFAGK